MADLDVFMISSKTEGLGTSILDAFACRVPVVATAAGGIPELVEHKKTGLLVAIKDAKALAESILLLNEDRVLRESLSRAAWDKVQTFSKEQTAIKTLKEYQSLFV